MDRLYICHTFISQDPNFGQFHSIKEMTNQLDYVKEIGFNCIMSNPILESRGDYHGYNINDYYQINPALGTMEDFEEFIRECERLGITYIMDFCFAHTSDTHYWYQDFKKGANDFYVAHNWKDPNYDMETSMHNTIYEWSPELNKYLVCAFNRGMPSLNVESHAMKEEIRKVIHYWLGKSKNIGMRLDAIFWNQVTAHNKDGLPYARFIKQCIDEVNPEAIIISEVWKEDQLIEPPMPYAEIFGRTFNFYNSFNIMWQLRDNVPYEKIRLVEPYNKGVSFTCNHDTSRLLTMLDGDKEKVKTFLRVLIEKSQDDVCIYYGTEADYEGLIGQPGEDYKVRQTYDVYDMAKVIKDKDSLFWYIRHLIKKDKNRRKEE